ncbi:MAG: glutamate-1-semialdehyde 2,1-aminomutase [Bdellovibrionota bacterium]
MITSKELFERSKKVAPGGVHSPVRAFKSVGGEPLFFKSANGAFLTSVEGISYIDFCQSFGPNLLGHRDPDVANEVREAIDVAWTFGACEPYSLELAEWITQKVPSAEKIRFVCSGTEAVMSALRVARAATGRHKVLKFDGCYHGHVDSLLVKAGSGLAGASASDSAGVSPSVAAETLVSPLDDIGSLEKVFASHGSEIAAVVLEPLPANFGLLKQRKEFIDAIQTLAKKHGALLFFDEVISGFRVGLGGMAERLNIKPDLVTYGKVIGGGFPVGAYAGRADLLDLVAPNGPVYQAGTLAANPIGVRAGLATLKKVVRLSIYDELEKRTERFTKTLNDAFTKMNVPVEVAREASIFWLHLKTGKTVRTPNDFHPESRDVYKKIFHNCLKNNIYLAPSAFEVGFVSYAHTDAVLDQAATGIIQAVREAYGQK